MGLAIALGFEVVDIVVVVIAAVAAAADEVVKEIAETAAAADDVDDVLCLLGTWRRLLVLLVEMISAMLELSSLLLCDGVLLSSLETCLWQWRCWLLP